MTKANATNFYRVRILIENVDAEMEATWDVCVNASNSVDAIGEARREIVSRIREAGKCYECS